MENIIEELKKEISSVKSIQDINELKSKYLGKKGSISALSLKMKEIANEEKKEFGMKLNKIKNEANELLDGKREEIEKKLLDLKLKNESIDISLPGLSIPAGSPNIVEKMVEEVEDVCMSMGYDVVDGPEIEKDKYNFEMLNLPKGHPARDAQDTFYIEGEELLLRSQTSPVQIRCMLKGEGKEPIRMICPGKAD